MGRFGSQTALPGCLKSTADALTCSVSLEEFIKILQVYKPAKIHRGQK
jgi:hypothetical protein